MVNWKETLGRILLFTHTDMDGYGPVVLLKALGIDFDYEACDYNNIDEVITSYMDNGKLLNYDAIFITDISVNKETAERLNEFNKKHIDIMLLDHHETAEWLNEYDWALVSKTDQNGILVSGTYLFNEFIKSLNDGVSASYLYDTFSSHVRDYDTWLWTTNDNKIAKHLNDLFYIIGPDDFVREMANKINYELPLLNKEDENILRLERKRIDRYYKDVLDNSYVLPINIKREGGSIAFESIVCFAEQYHSEIGNRLCEDSGKDLAIIINPQKRKISYRSIGNKIHLGNEVAKPLGGGGHMNSAGSQISLDEIKNIVGSVLNEK